MLKYNVVDAGAFFRRDPIAHAEDAGAMPTQGFRPSSRSTRDCRLSASATMRIRVAPPARPNTGRVSDAPSNTPVDASWARPTIAKPGKNARKKAAARKRAGR